MLNYDINEEFVFINITFYYLRVIFLEFQKMRHILVIGAGRSASSLIKYLLENSEKENLHVTIGDLS